MNQYAQLSHAISHVPQRLWTWSDVHVDYAKNLELIKAVSPIDFRNDTLILAGDVTDKLELLEECLFALTERFANVVYVPGNHELWVRNSPTKNSLDKLYDIQRLCESLDILTQPVRIGTAAPERALWVVPLLSWYHGKGHPDTLYGEKPGCDDRTAEMWSDFFLAKWPESMADDVAQYMLQQNTQAVEQPYDAPVVSVSHFLPRQDLMKPSKGIFKYIKALDPYPEFNFSEVAGSQGIEKQIRQLQSSVHIYGHQHRNKIREYDGVTYVSHCMGYPKERKIGLISNACRRPLLIWDTDKGFQV